MPFSVDEPICPKFQPNIFDPLRCHDCLRQRHLHSGSGETPEGSERGQKPSTDTFEKMRFADTGGGSVKDKRVALTTVSSQGEEKDTSSRVRKRRQQTGSVQQSSWVTGAGGRGGVGSGPGNGITVI